MQDLSHIFVTSDHHFGSWQLPGFLKVFTQEQEKELIEKWNSIVGKDDLVYYNGDFCDGNFRDLCNYFKQLNGQIVLIRGNHEKFSDGIYKAVFKDVVGNVVLDRLDLVVHHVPGIRVESREVFGHLHRGNPVQNDGTIPTAFCSCVQSNDGYPVSLKQVVDYFKSQTCQVDC